MPTNELRFWMSFESSKLSHHAPQLLTDFESLPMRQAVPASLQCFSLDQLHVQESNTFMLSPAIYFRDWHFTIEELAHSPETLSFGNTDAVSKLNCKIELWKDRRRWIIAI